MSTRSFIILAVSVVAVGGLLGGLFIGGYELGKRNAPGQDLATADLSTLPSPGGRNALPASGGMGAFSVEGQPESLYIPPDIAGDLIEFNEDGEMDMDAIMSEIRRAMRSDNLGGNLGRGGGAFGLAGGPGGGLFGTIEGVEGNVVTVSTPQGELQFMLDDDTEIQGLAELEPEDLAVGRSVTVSGQPGEDGAMTATTVFMLPEDIPGFGGPFPGVSIDVSSAGDAGPDDGTGE